MCWGTSAHMPAPGSSLADSSVLSTGRQYSHGRLNLGDFLDTGPSRKTGSAHLNSGISAKAKPPSCSLLGSYPSG